MKPKSRTWIRTHRRDMYYRLAKDKGLRSRAFFKLTQAAKKSGFINPSDFVLDLGAAPGGWAQAARAIVGNDGYVLGVDIVNVIPLPWKNVEFIIGDITRPETMSLILEKMKRSPDTVLSDASPKISGVWEVDHARQIDLAESALRIAVNVLRPGGCFFVKVFQGDLFENFIKEVKQYFSMVKIVKPAASRPTSSEIYILGKDFKAKRAWLLSP